MHLHVIDIAIIVLYLATTVVVGYWFPIALPAT